MIEQTLSKHRHIALDFDDCLLDGPHSRLLTDYMAAYSEKKFSIITNRPARCKRDTIAVANGLMLRREMPHHFQFSHIILSPDEDLCGDTVDRHFKGKAAVAIGATILIDDDIEHRDGCISNAIEFLHLPCEPSKAIKVGLF